MGHSQDQLRAFAGRVASRAELVDVRMVKSAAEHLGFPVAGTPLNYDLDIQPNAHFDSENHALIVSADFALTMDQAVGEDEERRDIASFTFTLVALFDTPEGVTFNDEELEGYGATTGIFSLYPYAREYVQDVTGRMGLPPLTLGVYRISPSEPTPE